jgi:Ca2+:H+ antiporter
VALVLPAVFYKSLVNNVDFVSDPAMITYNAIKISRGVAIISLVGYLIYVAYQTISHDGLFHEIYEADEHKDNDRHEELAKPKLTLTEVLVALAISLACVALIAVSLVQQTRTLWRGESRMHSLVLSLCHWLRKSPVCLSPLLSRP